MTNTYDLFLPFVKLEKYYDAYTIVANPDRTLFSDGLEIFFGEFYPAFMRDINSYGGIYEEGQVTNDDEDDE